MKEEIEKLCQCYGFGTLCKEPEEVAGGLLHRMYRVCTTSGEYAVKRLNPEIMKRREAVHNMICSEKIARAFAEEVPVVAARVVDGKQLLSQNGAYYMVFDWLEGTPVYPPQITGGQCRQIGEILGKLHAKQLVQEGVLKESGIRSGIFWEDYLKQAKKQEAPWAERLEELLPRLMKWDAQVTQCAGQLAEDQVISHRDLDPKNVLWKENAPYIIDWEAAGYVNPYKELVEILFYWAVDEAGMLVPEKVQAALEGYQAGLCGAKKRLVAVDWSTVLACSCEGMLGWLEYCVKRALGMEISDESERQQGVEQMLGTMEELCRQETQTEWLGRYLQDCGIEVDVCQKEMIR